MKLTEHTKIRKEKFGAVVFETLSEKIFITDQIGGEILDLIQQGHTLDDIVAVLANRYQAGKRTIENDVTEFTDQLKSSNIVQG